MSVSSAQPAPLVVDVETLRGRALVPVLVYVGMLVAVVSSLGAPLIPTIATDYGVSLDDAQWSLTVTLLVGAVATPVVGRLGDGSRRTEVLVAALGVLVAGSVLAALPDDGFAALLTGRALQGVGLALVPLAMSIARDHLDPARARAALATLSVTAAVGVGLGYPLTGLVAEHLSFHDAFWIAAGLSLVAMVLVAVVVPTRSHRPPNTFDLPGAALLGVGLAALLLAITESQTWGWGSLRLWALAIGAVAVIGCWVWHELRTAAPIVDLRLMRGRTVLSANVTIMLAGVGMYMLLSMVIRYVQTPRSESYGLGASVVVSGFVLLPLSVTSYLSTRLVTYLTRWVDPLRIMPLGALGIGASLAFFAADRRQLWEIFVVMGIVGLGIGASFAVIPRIVVGAVPAHETSSALALTQVVRTVGFTIGSALSATILAAHTFGSALLPVNRGYTVASLVGVGLCVVTAFVSWVLPARTEESAR